MTVADAVQNNEFGRVNLKDQHRVGILITHGTDTMAWTLPYLRYSIKLNHVMNDN